MHLQNLYCFQYTSSNEEIAKSAGWNYYTLEAEYKRQKVPNEEWSLCNLNRNYELCDTCKFVKFLVGAKCHVMEQYVFLFISDPRQIFVPTEANTAMLMGSSKFRSKARLPVLTYLHSNKASICRCSQPLSGFSAR